MKSIRLALAAAAIAMVTSTSVTLPTAATAAPATDIVAFCKVVTGPAPHPQNEGTLGECNSLFITSEKNNYAAHLCDFLIESGQIDMKFSDCVQAVRDGSL